MSLIPDFKFKWIQARHCTEISGSLYFIDIRPQLPCIYQKVNDNLIQPIKMSATVDNCFLRVHEEVGGIEKALYDPTSLFIVVNTTGESYVTKDTAFLLPLFQEGTGSSLKLSTDDGSLSFLGWFVPPTVSPELITLHTESILRPGMHAIFSVRMDLNDLETVAHDTGGRVTPSTGLTSLSTEPGIGALLQSVMLAKFLTNCSYCSVCGKKLTMRDSCGLAQACRTCVKEYFLPVQPYVCGLVTYGDKILLLPPHTDDASWGLPLFELEVCETPLGALFTNLYDVTAVNIKQHMHSAITLDMTISSADISGLITIWQVCINRNFEPRDNKCARWFTKEQCIDILRNAHLSEVSVDGFLLRKWIDGTLGDHVTNTPAPFRQH
ncbi:hypothetical protein QR46_0345 [Giardia duodenalis assemblage B]|uniref:Uncharacterized protein n=1 Tax=Giardia duodenalis assemblage B TaxID=1394984 RepID=A0A132NZY5_GIAIN|nr:hypothetical protein QR46_0345 [Giardia intestinalis assemblage B]